MKCSMMRISLPTHLDELIMKTESVIINKQDNKKQERLNLLEKLRNSLISENPTPR